MKTTISINNNDLNKCLDQLKHVIVEYPDISILTNIRLVGDGKTIEITGSDNRSTIFTECKYKGDPFNAVIPYSPLRKALSISGNKLDLIFDNEICTIKSGRQECIIPLFPFGEYPNYPKSNHDAIIETPVDIEFIVALKKAVEFLSTDELRVDVTKVLLHFKNGYVTIVGTNAHILFWEKYEISGHQDYKTLISSRNIELLLEESCVLKVSENSFEFQYSKTKIVGRLDSNSKYPDYEKALPKKDNFIGKIGFQKLVFLEALEKINKLKYNREWKIRLEVLDDQILLSTSIKDYDSDVRFQIYIPATYSGDYNPFEFSIGFLEKVINSIDGDLLYMTISTEGIGIIISSIGQKRLIMPLLIT
jgi:DNA polymerase III sliding clamp (beta) subunit (PCNA family)